MNNPLDNVPLNTKRQYVMGKTKSGCEVYMPVDSTNPVVLNKSRDSLQQQLDQQYSALPEFEPLQG